MQITSTGPRPVMFSVSWQRNTQPMIEKYVFLELMFLVPLMLCVAVPIMKRREHTEMRFLKSATALCGVVFFLNVVMWRSGFMFPAFVVLLLLVAAYSTHPSILLSLATSLLACVAVIATGVAANWYADSHRGSFADQNHALFTGIVSLFAGIVAVILLQLVAKKLVSNPAAS